MILQTASGLRPEIKRWGCYLMCLLYLINKLTGAEMTVARINKLYKLFIAHGWIDSQCTILNPVAILGWAGIKARIIIQDGTHKLPPDYPTGVSDYEVAHFRIPGANQGHFVLGPVVKYDTAYRVGYDPYGKSRSVRHGVYLSKRVFRIDSVPSTKEVTSATSLRDAASVA